jgi:hypothetical protein
MSCVELWLALARSKGPIMLQEKSLFFEAELPRTEREDA